MADEEKQQPADLDAMSEDELAEFLQNASYEDPEGYWKRTARDVKHYLNEQKRQRQAKEDEEGANYYAKFWREFQQKRTK